MQPSVDLAPEVVVGDRYRLLESLASGGTAAVWRAEDVRLGREVAVKVLREELDPELRTRAEREAKVLASLDHRNLVRVFDSGEDDGIPFIVMELLDGESLSAIIDERGALPVEEAVALVADVADGLGAAHERGVVHRDVKPANIVCKDQVPTVVDFGIARTFDATTLTRGLVVGTASYIAPEQAQGLAVGPPCDVYSLACVLYELLTGRPPFQGESPVAIAVKHVQDDVVPPGDIAQVPPALDAVVVRCLAKDPALRPADGTAMAAALRAALVQPATEETVAIGAPIPSNTAVMPAIQADADLIDPSPLPVAPVPPVAPPPAGRRLPRNVGAGAGPLVALGVAAMVLVGILLIARSQGGGIETRPVPDVTNAAVEDATTYLEGAGLAVDIEPVPADAAPGTVVASEPGPGEMIPEGGTVILSVSSGPGEAPATTAPPPPPAEGGGDDDGDGRGRGRDQKDDD
jgi:predicted Ser/Thr protein kinase